MELVLKDVSVEDVRRMIDALEYEEDTELVLKIRRAAGLPDEEDCVFERPACWATDDEIETPATHQVDPQADFLELEREYYRKQKEEMGL